MAEETKVVDEQPSDPVKLKAQEQKALAEKRAAEVEAQQRQSGPAPRQTAAQLHELGEEIQLRELEKRELEDELNRVAKRLAEANEAVDQLRRKELDASKLSDTEANMQFLAAERDRRQSRAQTMTKLGKELVDAGLLSTSGAKLLTKSPIDKAIADRVVRERKEANKATFKQPVQK